MELEKLVERVGRDAQKSSPSPTVMMQPYQAPTQYPHSPPYLPMYPTYYQPPPDQQVAKYTGENVKQQGGGSKKSPNPPSLTRNK